MLDTLYDTQIRISKSVDSLRYRHLYDTINFNQRLFGLVGARGVGKTTLLLQYLKSKFDDPTVALYVSADSVTVNAIGIIEIVEEHHRNGGKVLVIDEVHKLGNWAQIIKTIYDSYPKMRLIISGSSAFQIKKQGVDLSRRLTYYNLPGLSFREFIAMKTETDVPHYDISDLLKNYGKISTELSSHFEIFPLFREYLQYGYYPFWLEGKNEYYQKLDNIINKILYEDIPSAFPIKFEAIRQLKRFLYIIATSNPFQINVSELSRELGIARESLYQYLDFLEQSFIINRLWKQSKGKSYQRKPEKVFLDNPNMILGLNSQMKPQNKGIIRESFFVNQMLTIGKLFTTNRADFEDGNNIQFEIGGKSKKSNQLDSDKTGYLVLDDITIGSKNKIPLYLFGFLY